MDWARKVKPVTSSKEGIAEGSIYLEFQSTGLRFYFQQIS